MPIVRSYTCPDCFHHLEVVLSADQWDAEAPDCPRCAGRGMNQEFKPVAIGGSALSRAGALAEEIARQDYGVSNMSHGNRVGDVAKVTYRDETGNGQPAHMGRTGVEALEAAVRIGRETRLRHGSGLDVLQGGLASGDIPDLIANSKKISPRVW